MFFLVYLLVFLVLIIASWFPTIAANKLGITEVFPVIWKSVQKTFSWNGNGFMIIAFAFLLYAVLQSKTFEALFASKRKWLQKRKFTTIAIITIITSLLASNFWWADEFLHFYPLLVPLLLTMGFDVFSAVLCLYGGTIVGVLGSIKCDSHRSVFNQHVNEPASTHFTGTEGLWFRIIIWLILTTILVFFNIWYCNKIQKKPTALPTKEAQTQKVPVFNWRRKLILFLAFFFISVSILGSFGVFTNASDYVARDLPPEVCNEYEEKEYKDLGTVKTSLDSDSEKNKIEIAKINRKKKSSWGKFGNWDDPQKAYWFTIGGIIICLVAKLNIINTLITAVTKAIPIILTYIFAYAVPLLIQDMKWKINPLAPLLKNRFVALPVIFLFMFVFCFFSINLMKSILPIIAQTLKSLSTNTLAYSVTIMFMGRFLAEGVSPIDGNLQMTLKSNKITYKQYIKKTWVLWTIIFFILLISISILPFFIDRGGG